LYFPLLRLSAKEERLPAGKEIFQLFLQKLWPVRLNDPLQKVDHQLHG